MSGTLAGIKDRAGTRPDHPSVNGGWGAAPRTAIGQRRDGIVLFLVIDGRTLTRPGASMNDLIEIMKDMEHIMLQI